MLGKWPHAGREIWGGGLFIACIADLLCFINIIFDLFRDIRCTRARQGSFPIHCQSLQCLPHQLLHPLFGRPPGSDCSLLN